jgi:hypothetical protein
MDTLAMMRIVQPFAMRCGPDQQAFLVVIGTCAVQVLLEGLHHGLVRFNIGTAR